LSHSLQKRARTRVFVSAGSLRTVSTHAHHATPLCLLQATCDGASSSSRQGTTSLQRSCSTRLSPMPPRSKPSQVGVSGPGPRADVCWVVLLLRATGSSDWAPLTSRGACKVEGCCQPPVIEVSIVTFHHRVAVCACLPPHPPPRGPPAHGLPAHVHPEL
jgi:hypothetical protein